MGNLHSERKVGPINPNFSPYLHILPDLMNGGHRWVDNLKGLVIDSGIHTGFREGLVIDFSLKGRISIDFLPPITQVPPPTYDGQELVQRSIREYKEAILALATSASILKCSHGSGWGLYPEELLSNLLNDAGIRASRIFPVIVNEGRKRIQRHAIFLG